MAFKSVRIYTFVGEMNALLMNPLGFKRINSTINVRILTDLKAMSSSMIQVFATTHSRDTVKAFTSVAQKDEYKNMATILDCKK